MPMRCLLLLLALGIVGANVSPRPVGLAMRNTFRFQSVLNSPTRSDAYRRALDRALEPNDTVVAIEGGGLLAMMAGRTLEAAGGSGHVYALEPHPRMMGILREAISANELQRRVTVLDFRGLAARTQTDLADVVLTEIGPSLLLHLAAMSRARRHFAKPSARLIPGSGRQYLTFAESPRWGNLTRVTSVDGLDLSLLNSLRSPEFVWSSNVGFTFDAYGWRELTHPFAVLDVDFHLVDHELPQRKTFRVPVLHGGIAHAAYSHMELFEDRRGEVPMLSTHPRSLPDVHHEAQWGVLYASVIDDEIGPSGLLEVQPGDVLEVEVEYKQNPDGVHFDMVRVKAHRGKREL